MSGDAYQTAQKELLDEHARRRPETDSHVMGLIIYADKTTTRLQGQVEFYPIYAIAANASFDTFHTQDARVELGFLPMVYRPALQRSSKKMKKGSSGSSTNSLTQKFKDTHDEVLDYFWGLLVDKLINIRAKGLAVRWEGMKMGDRHFVYPHVLFFNGDYPELQAAAAVTGLCRLCFTHAKHEDITGERPRAAKMYRTPKKQKRKRKTALKSMGAAGGSLKWTKTAAYKAGVRRTSTAWDKYPFRGVKVRATDACAPASL